jgi:ABC-2 type transport system permease protein
VIRHFAYFIGRTVRNRAMRQTRRMQSPRYAIAALVGMLYFFFIFAMPSADAGTMGGTWIRAGRVAGPLLLGLLAAWWWLWGGHRFGLMLTPAETHLLLPAPLTRVQLVRFKIMQAQPALLFSAVFGTLVTRGTGLPWPLRLLSLWLLLATLHQHQIGASLVHAAAHDHGRRGLRRNAVPLALFGIAFMTLMWSLFGAVTDIRASGSLSDAAARVIALLEEPGPHIVLAPFRLLLAPTLATSAGAWLLPFATGCVVLLAHYVWVIRTDAAFEESAAAEGHRREVITTAVRSGGFSRVQFAQRDRSKKVAQPWLPLRSTGRSAYAIFWKNMLYAQRSIGTGRSVIGIVIMVAVIVSLSSSGSDTGDMLRFVGVILLSIAGALTLFGPFAVRNDLRTDLKHVDQLRTYPVRSRDLVAAEVAAATVTVSVPQLVLLAAAIAIFAAIGVLGAGTAVLLAGTAVLVLPLVNALAVLIQNVLALLYPSWIRLGEQGGGGMEMVGQNMIVMIGTALLLAVCAIPPILAGALVGAPLAMLIGELAVLAGVAAAVLAAATEVVLLVHWLGGLYDRTDPVAAGLLR